MDALPLPHSSAGAGCAVLPDALFSVSKILCLCLLDLDLKMISVLIYQILETYFRLQPLISIACHNPICVFELTITSRCYAQNTYTCQVYLKRSVEYVKVIYIYISAPTEGVTKVATSRTRLKRGLFTQ